MSIVTPPQAAQSLHELLHSAFGFRSFRANQDAVCRAAIAGQDVLLVMPTGAGKSLCYQLPALARGGTTLVVSPLIALMDDQAAKLSALGFSVARIHSGMDRSASRQACVDYLNGSLQFLFIAPERLRVPGFPQMLAKRKPSLIAIDEAHCISQWGHDFRPDYRTLGQHLPALRPAPVIALTATATPIVQDDIVQQLGLGAGARFIHGFRRDNLAVEVVEVARSKRHGFTAELLSDPARRPAIVYAPTRKDAESLALELNASFPAAAYHAGLESQHRERVQHAFLSGKLDAVVATIAFGMGIDKADVRTVIHTALPASLEAYYQEIGRAGRDGLHSRTILMHSYADRRTHDFFIERDYPEVEELDKIFRSLTVDPQPIDVIRGRLKMDAEVFDKALEKLYIHGAATIDYEDNASLGQRDWRQTYAAQASQRRAQLDLVVRYAESSECRMAALVRHFGDTADARRACGHCDYCAPQHCVAQSFRSPSKAEQQTVHAVIRALRNTLTKSTGKLYTELFPKGDVTRNDFEDMLAAMATANLIHLEDASFEKDGRSIAYRKATLTQYGEDIEQHPELQLQLKDTARAATPSRSRKSSSSRSEPRPRAVVANREEPLTPQQSELEEKLREWRKGEAMKNNVPAFCILSNKALRALAVECPTTEEDLLTVPGIGQAKAAKFGDELCRLCSRS